MAFSRTTASMFLYPLVSKLIDWAFRYWMLLLLKFGVVTINTDITKAASYRGKVLWEEATRRGIPMHNFFTLGKATDIYEATVKGRRLFFTGLPRPSATKTGSEWWLDDKWILKQKLMAANLPVARGGAFTRFAPMLELFHKLEKPVIVKPRIGSRGRHTSTQITTEEQLRNAFVSAKQLCYWVVMEEHLFGPVDRGTMIDGKLAGVLAGFPPRVTGDGIHTITELIEIKNTNRPATISAVTVHQQHLNFLARQNLTLESVIPAGQAIDLLHNIGISYGGNSAEVTGVTHPEIKRILEQAAAVVGDPIIGFDFIIGDRSKSPHDQKWGIIECNGTPFINLHHDPIEGPPVNVAAKVWDYVETHIDEL